jgi:hypothetical protein
VPLDAEAHATSAPTREIAPPSCAVTPAPSGGWTVVADCDAANTVRLVPPGMRLDDRSAAHFFARGLDWFADGKSLLYWDGRQLRRHSVDGDDRALLDRNFTYGLAVAPDGKTAFLSFASSHVRRELLTNFADRPRPWAK